MSVTSTQPYIGEPRDSVKHYQGKQIIYVSWDHHLLFAAPFLLYVSPEMTFREMVEGPLTTLIQPDPDAQGLDWSQVGWATGQGPLTPDFEASLEANGIVHKTQLRFSTPGLNTVCG